jgi:hypothetical protein
MFQPSSSGHNPVPPILLLPFPTPTLICDVVLKKAIPYAPLSYTGWLFPGACSRTLQLSLTAHPLP